MMSEPEEILYTKEEREDLKEFFRPLIIQAPIEERKALRDEVKKIIREVKCEDVSNS